MMLMRFQAFALHVRFSYDAKAAMLKRLFPTSADNAFQGYRVACWIFGLLLLMKVMIGLNSTFNGHTVASSADGIPLDTYTPAGSQTIVALFSLWGVTQILLCLLGLVVLVCYRSLVPLAFTFLLIESSARKAVLHFLPIPSAGPPAAGYVGYMLLALIVIGLVLSLGPYKGVIPAGGSNADR